jgi:hypothetical protein
MKQIPIKPNFFRTIQISNLRVNFETRWGSEDVDVLAQETDPHEHRGAFFSAILFTVVFDVNIGHRLGKRLVFAGIIAQEPENLLLNRPGGLNS